MNVVKLNETYDISFQKRKIIVKINIKQKKQIQN